MLDVVEACVSRWKMKLNSRKSKIMVVWKREAGLIWRIGEKIVEDVEVLRSWFDRSYKVMFS